MKLHQLQEEQKKLEAWVRPQGCIVCQKQIPAPFGRHETGWTCSGKCERTYEATPRLGHATAEC